MRTFIKIIIATVLTLILLLIIHFIFWVIVNKIPEFKVPVSFFELLLSASYEGGRLVLKFFGVSCWLLGMLSVREGD
jgi:hypothetical protein